MADGLDGGGPVSVVDVVVVAAALVDVVRTGAARLPPVVFVQADTPESAPVTATPMIASRRSDLDDLGLAYLPRAHGVGRVIQRD